MLGTPEPEIADVELLEEEEEGGNASAEDEEKKRRKSGKRKVGSGSMYVLHTSKNYNLILPQ